MRLSKWLELAALLAVALLTGCGGGGNSGGGGGGGGSSSIIVAPSSEMISSTVGTGTIGLQVLGRNFSQSAQVLVDGAPADSTTYGDANTLFAILNLTYSTFLGTHQITVSDGGKTSKSATFSLYLPKTGPNVMQATPGYYAGNESDALFLLAGDLNGDGFADVVLPGQSLTILNGQADGSLALPQFLSAQSPWAAGIGDVDGNSTLDLVTFIVDSNYSGTLSVLLNDGHGNFQTVTGPQGLNGIYPGAVALADLDGDGLPDIVLLASAPPGVNLLEWCKNEGGGNFAAPVTLTSMVSDDFYTYAVADANGDGKPDVLYAIYNATSSAEVVHTLVNQGNGQFNDTVTPGVSATGPFNVLDFNSDGKPDLVLQVRQSNGSLKLESFAGNGDGSFTYNATSNAPGAGFKMVSGDFDHDGFPDLVGADGSTTPSHVVYFFGDGQGNFKSQTVIGPQGFSVTTADINGDGMPDVIVPDRFNFVSVLLGRTDRAFPSLTALSPAVSGPVSIGDIDGDGKPDILVGGDNYALVYATDFQNMGNGVFQFGTFTDPHSYATADLNGHGVVDLIGGDAADLTIWPNNHTFVFGDPINIPPPVQGYFTAADMDGDGHPDIVGVGQILYGDGAYHFTNTSTPQTFNTYAIGDFNGDGKLDIASDTFVLLNTGGRTFNAVNAGAGAPNLSQGSTPVVGDFNGDGLDDIAIVWPQNTGVYIYFSRGDGTFYIGAILDTGQLVGGFPGEWAITVGDFDGDGRPDIAVGLWSSQQIAIFFSRPNGEFDRSFYASGADTIGMASGALVHSGKPDLVIANYNLAFAPANVNVMLHK